MIEKKLIELIKDSIESSGWEEKSPEPTIEKPSNPDFGDYATNIALELGSRVDEDPRSIANNLKENLEEKYFDDVSIDGPGFINFTLSTDFVRRTLVNILKKGEDFYTSDRGKGIKIQIEFVSSNPTGPLTVGHGRQAVLGDILASCLEALGYEVAREYYFNDEGEQVKKLAKTVWARYKQALDYNEKIPEDGYKGDYLKRLGKEIANEKGDNYLQYSSKAREFFKKRGLERMIKHIKEDLKNLGISFDNWFRESTLHEKGEVEATLENLTELGATYEKNGATWLKASSYGAPKDVVLVKSSGDPTYLLPDVAYHVNKKDRGFDQAIVVLGADHHRHVKNMKAALDALNFEPDFYRVLLHQFVSLKKEGKVERMSTREGEFVTLRKLIDDLGKDVVRYFMAARKPESHLEFDYTLAKEDSMDNPVYYIQYAHTRIASIFREADLSPCELDFCIENLKPLDKDEEKQLIMKLDRLPEVIESAAEDFSPHLLGKYAERLATDFHKYYNSFRVLSSDRELKRARLMLCYAVQAALKELLRLIGVSAPTRM